MYNDLKAFAENHNVTLVAVSKTKPVEAIRALYDLGQRDFGENKVQEMVEKQSQLPADIRWHLIGHLQKNKVKYIAPFVAMIHAVDSLELLTTIQNQAIKNNRQIPVLIQFHIADETTKFGLSYDEAEAIFEEIQKNPMPELIIAGVMGMATFTEDKAQIKAEFQQLKKYFDTIKAKYFANDPEFIHISMGMSGDYPIAVEAGATMIRIGSAIFGFRD
ncbi:MAG: YggS family pyridoxal phosphate-dependent enzyme [Chitinophagales bacterium]|nr:YggS family pyridoxal phosphate-dependent enzyme [Chitinophagales bacterium]